MIYKAKHLKIVLNVKTSGSSCRHQHIQVYSFMHSRFLRQGILTVGTVRDVLVGKRARGQAMKQRAEFCSLCYWCKPLLGINTSRVWVGRRIMQERTKGSGSLTAISTMRCECNKSRLVTDNKRLQGAPAEQGDSVGGSGSEK